MVFNLTLRALAGNQLLKKQIGKMIQIKKKKNCVKEILKLNASHLSSTIDWGLFNLERLLFNFKFTQRFCY